MNTAHEDEVLADDDILSRLVAADGARRLSSPRGTINDSQPRIALDLVDRSGIPAQIETWRADDNAGKNAGGRRPILGYRTVLALLVLMAREGSPLLISLMADAVAHRLSPSGRQTLGLEGLEATPNEWYFRIWRTVNKLLTVIDPYPAGRKAEMDFDEYEALAARRDPNAVAARQAARLGVQPTHRRDPQHGPRAHPSTVERERVHRRHTRQSTSQRRTRHRQENSRQRTRRPLVHPRRRPPRPHRWGQPVHPQKETLRLGSDHRRANLQRPGKTRRLPPPRRRHRLRETRTQDSRHSHASIYVHGRARTTDRARHRRPGVLPQLQSRRAATPTQSTRVRSHLRLPHRPARVDRAIRRCPASRRVLVLTRHYQTTHRRHQRLARERHRRRDLLQAHPTARPVHDSAQRESRRKRPPTDDVPAAGPTATASCPLKELVNQKPDGQLLRIIRPPKHVGAICTNKRSLSFPPDAGAKYGQAMQYGSTAWHATYSTARNTIEGFNAYIKDGSHEAVDQSSRRRLRGQTAQYFLVAVQIASANIRKILTFLATEAGENERTTAVRDAPRKRRTNAVKLTNWAPEMVGGEPPK